ncbi:MAG: hypothetical protein ACOY16_04530 [Chloroflexota bacterium]
MYAFLLFIHNLFRWVVLIAGIVTVVLAWLGWLKGRPWSRANQLYGIIFTSAMDVQLLVGVLLYFIFSPLTTAAMRDFGAAMQNEIQRFFTIEHGTVMLLAIIFGHVGSIMSKKASTDRQRFQRAALWFSLALLMIILAIPWYRPLLRGL